MFSTTLNALANFPDQLQAHYTAVPPAFKNWAPSSWDGIPSEPFTALEQVCHIRDIEVDGYHVRFHRALHETNPVLLSIDSEALARERAYCITDADQALAVFRIARARTVELITSLNGEQFGRIASFDGYGELSVRSLVHYLCSHDQQHLAGLQWLLGKIDASLATARS
jgi:hypothetical protein